MELVELEGLTDADWAQLRDGETDSFGAVGEAMHWRGKDRYLGLRTEDGRLVAAAGAGIFRVEVEGADAFDVVGIGGVIVTHTLRGRGLFDRVVPPLLELAAGLGPERAMLFCLPERMPLYERLGFRLIDAPVWVDQPGGRIEMRHHRTMWLALRDDPSWPPGRVDVPGLPF